MCEFRTLTKDDVELRAARIYYKGNEGVHCKMLVYKDARVDRSVLNESVGKFGWQSEFVLINGNLFCKVSIKNPEGIWISKMDVGTESNTEKEKGQASDAFKRACFAWGIGEELYTAPDIDFPLLETEYKQDGADKYGKPIYKSFSTFSVSRMDVDEKTRKITAIDVVDSNGHKRYHWTSKPTLKEMDHMDFLDYASEKLSRADIDAKYYLTSENWVKIHDRIANDQ